MTKPEQPYRTVGDIVVDPANPTTVREAIIDIMTDPTFTPEQLPELRQQILEADGPVLKISRGDSWNIGIDAMFRRCETYPQYVKLVSVLSGMDDDASRTTDWRIAQADLLARQATSEELLQALTWETQNPEGWWKASDHLVVRVAHDQLTGPVIEQLPWKNQLLDYATTAEQNQATETTDFEQVRSRRRQLIVEHIQQQLLGGDNNAWTVFLGIVEPGGSIGDAAELACAIENRTIRNKN